ncbi:MAG: hypothetical protein ACLGQU_08540 [Acidobacteriota bacterium]|jgi:hypothetical protein
MLIDEGRTAHWRPAPIQITLRSIGEGRPNISTSRRSSFHRIVPECALAVVLTLVCSTAFAAPATFVTALPVAENQVLVRFNVQPLFGSEGYRDVEVPVNIGYGLNPNWALFTTIHQGSTTLDGNPSSGGEGDLLFFLRNTLYKRDKPKSTFRITPLAGLSLPTGSNHNAFDGVLAPPDLQTGSGTVDPYVGITSGYNSLRYGAAFDATWRYNPVTRSGYSPGSEFRSDGQAEITMLPIHFPSQGLPSLFVLSVEANYTQQSDSFVNGVETQDAAKTFCQDAILELASLHWEAGLGAQAPLLQDLASPSTPEEHTRYYAYFEYYLSAPNWHHRREQ